MRYFLDTEFDGFGGPLISLALVREDGLSGYYVLSEEASDVWVRENVLPILWSVPAERPNVFAAKPRTAKSAALDIAASLLGGDPDPVIVTDWPADIRYFCELIEFPGGQMAAIPSLKFELHRVDAYPTTLPGAVQHNAWWDAMALREKLSPPAESPPPQSEAKPSASCQTRDALPSSPDNHSHDGKEG